MVERKTEAQTKGLVERQNRQTPPESTGGKHLLFTEEVEILL
jgi:hypothetical protein